MAHRLFAYGTLLSGRVRHAVTGATFTASHATLPGFRRCRLKGAHYPAIVPDRAGHVDGLLLQGIGNRALRRLDAYKGREYLRRRVQVTVAAGATVTAWVYVLARRYGSRIARRDWKPAVRREVRKAPRRTGGCSELPGYARGVPV